MMKMQDAETGNRPDKSNEPKMRSMLSSMWSITQLTCYVPD